MAALNPPQQKAVSTLSGPLLVLAGAGTGKTRVVTYRIASLIRHGIQPERILAVTFTNKAASEMQQRVGQLLGQRQQSRPEISTFHSHCVQILRRHIRQLGYPAAVRHLRPGRPGEPGPERAARDPRGRRNAAARRSALPDQPLEVPLRAACRSGHRWPRPTRSIWPPWPIAATNER